MLAPRIDAEGGDYAGLVFLAGSPRPLREIIYDQNVDVIESLITDETKKREQKVLVEEELNKAKALKDMLDIEVQDMTVFGTNGYYLKEMDQYDVSLLVSELEKPLLFMQDEDDFQVYYDKDFVMWRERLENQDKTTFMGYLGLKHFLIEYADPDKGTIVEYETPNQVDTKVIQDIGQWILEQE